MAPASAHPARPEPRGERARAPRPRPRRRGSGRRRPGARGTSRRRAAASARAAPSAPKATAAAAAEAACELGKECRPAVRTRGSTCAGRGRRTTRFTPMLARCAPAVERRAAQPGAAPLPVDGGAREARPRATARRARRPGTGRARRRRRAGRAPQGVGGTASRSGGPGRGRRRGPSMWTHCSRQRPPGTAAILSDIPLITHFGESRMFR